MGEVQVGVTVAPLTDPVHNVQLNVTVDSGANYSVIPADILTTLGVQPTMSITVRYADGRPGTRALGQVLISVDGRTTPTLVVFGEPGDYPILGVTVLELLGLGIDPVGKKLIPIEPHQF